MRVGVIRNDLAQAILLADLEPVSRYNPAIEPRGQERYLAYPTVEGMTAMLANSTYGAGAVIQGSNISGSFPITLTGANNVLRLRPAASGTFTAYTVATGAYATLAALVVAVNTAIAASGITARAGVGTGTLALEGNTRGVSSAIAVDSVANGSTANTPFGFGATAITRTMPTAAAVLTAMTPPGGPLALTDTTIDAIGSGTSSTAFALIPKARGTHDAMRDVVAPSFAETIPAIESYLVGYIKGLRSASFNPDPRRIPALTAGAAVGVTADDGSAFSTTLPTVSSATLGTPSTGAVTIAGTGLGGELGGGSATGDQDTEVKFTGTIKVKLTQLQIEAAGGSVSSTAIVVPASLIPGAVVTTTSVQVKVRQHVSAVVALV